MSFKKCHYQAHLKYVFENLHGILNENKQVFRRFFFLKYKCVFGIHPQKLRQSLHFAQVLTSISSSYWALFVIWKT